jgi:hypothetical protein
MGVGGLTHPKNNCSSRVSRPDAPRDLGALLPFNHPNVVLTLQVKPELRAIAEVAPEPHGRVGGDRATMSVMRPDGTPISSDSRLALSLRVAISRFSKRPGCTTGAMAVNLCGCRKRATDIGNFFVIAGEAKQSNSCVIPGCAARRRPESMAPLEY